jgi:hypothetical protein
LHRKFELDTGALELFRRTRKPLTVTGLQLKNQRLGAIDDLLDRAVIWAQHQKLSSAKPASSRHAGAARARQIATTLHDPASARTALH